MSMAQGRSTDSKNRAKFDLSGELFFKRAFAHAASGLALVDLNGRFSYTNAAFTNLTGYTSRELGRLKISALMHPEDAKANAALRKKMLAGKIPGYVLEKRYIRKDGSLIWVKSSVSLAVDSNGEPVRIVGITEDVDERHRAEDALRESEARFRFMAESMPPKVFTADRKGAISYLSPQWINYTGLAFKDMNYQEWSQTVHPDDRKGNFDAWLQSVSTGEPFYFEHRLRRCDGSYRWHVCRAFALRDENGSIMEWIGSDTDIEELYQSRELRTSLQFLADQREQLIRANRLKDDFIMLASHQLRTPATGVKQYIGMLLEGYSDAVTDDQRKLLRSAYESNDRQLRIVDDLLRVARLDAGQISLSKSRCDLVHFIRTIVAERYGVFSNRKQNVVFTVRHKAIMTSVDVDLMRVVLENLLDNACKYSEAGATTSVDLLKTQGSLVIEVKDNGMGIRRKDQQRLFLKFSRLNNPLDEADTGTGLGLYWAKKIVELHGGTIAVASKLRQGSTFRIQLPVS